MDDYADRLLAKLAPEAVTQTLIRAGCFLSAYELLRSEIVDAVHDFYWHGDMENGQKVYDVSRYQEEVLARNPKSKYRASCAWLVDSGALTPEQIEALDAIYKHRHEIAHELPKFVIDLEFEIKTDLLLSAADCIRSLGVFWGRFTVDADPQWDGKEVADKDIQSGTYLLMYHLLLIAGLNPEDP